jgi:membrane protein
MFDIFLNKIGDLAVFQPNGRFVQADAVFALLAYLSVPHLFDEILLWMSYFVPTESMNLVKRVFSDVVATRNSGFLSFGIVGTIWTASGTSAAMIEALNVKPPTTKKKR